VIPAGQRLALGPGPPLRIERLASGSRRVIFRPARRDQAIEPRGGRAASWRASPAVGADVIPAGHRLALGPGPPLRIERLASGSRRVIFRPARPAGAPSRRPRPM